MTQSYKELGTEIGKLVEEKQAAYGNSFDMSADFLKLLWPDGVPVESYGDMLCVIRIFDKLKRIATNKGWNGESPYKDLCGYGLLGLRKDMVANEKQIRPDDHPQGCPCLPCYKAAENRYGTNSRGIG
jgi:hypothetical protein